MVSNGLVIKVHVSTPVHPKSVPREGNSKSVFCTCVYLDYVLLFCKPVHLTAICKVAGLLWGAMLVKIKSERSQM